jgi:hypothetical protein
VPPLTHLRSQAQRRPLGRSGFLAPGTVMAGAVFWRQRRRAAEAYRTKSGNFWRSANLTENNPMNDRVLLALALALLALTIAAVILYVAGVVPIHNK